MGMHCISLSLAAQSADPSRFSIGGYISLYSVPAVAMGKMEDAGRRVGMFVSLTGLGSIAGPPISGAICTATGGFVDAGYYSGRFMTYAIFERTLTLSRWQHYVWRCIATCGAVLPS
jgi:hypothetical protein